MTTATLTALGYHATRERTEIGGRTVEVLVVHEVPIFCACERDDFVADERWIAAAVKRAKHKQLEGFLPPLHIRHHEMATTVNDSVRAAGIFKITGAKPITLDGKRRLAIFADLILTDEWAQEAVMAMRYPYRSVEIFDPDKPPSIDSLALLDHEAPFHELPMLIIKEIKDVEGNGTPGFPDVVANATFCRPQSIDLGEEGDPVVACLRRGRHRALLFRSMTVDDDDIDDKDTDDLATDNVVEPKSSTKKKSVKKKSSKKKKTANFQSDDDDDDDKNMQDAEGVDVGGVVKAIKSGKISIADMDAILEAIQSQDASPDDTDDLSEPAPAAAPGGEAMQKQFTKLQADNARLKADHLTMRKRLDSRDQGEVRSTDLRTAMQRLEGRMLGSDIEEELEAFHKDYGSKAFKTFVDRLVKTNPIVGDDDDVVDPALAATLGKSTPKVAMKFQKHGTEAITKAAAFAREHEQLKASGLRSSVDDYVRRNMKRVGYEVEEEDAA